MIIIYIHINRGVCHDIRYMIIYIYIYHGVRHDIRYMIIYIYISIMEFAMIYDICPVFFFFFVCVYIYSVVAVGNFE